MKLLYCCHADNYHIEKWIPAMEKVGLEIHILTFRPSKVLTTQQTVISTLWENAITWLDFWTLAPKIRQTYFEHHCDALLCSFASTYGLAGFLSSVKPFFVQTWSRDINAEQSTNKKDRLISSLLSRYICSNAEGITTDGPHFKQHVEEQWKEIKTENICSTWWGIDTEFWSTTIEEKNEVKKKLGLQYFDQVLLSPRGLFWYYRPVEVLQAILELANQYPNTFFIVASLGHQTDYETQQLKRTAEKKYNIRVIDFLMEKSIFREYLIVSDFLVSVPLFDGVSEVIQEGMLVGAIPVLNPIPANMLFQKEGASVFFTSSVQPKRNELIETIKSVLEMNKDELDTLRQTNKRFVLTQCNVSSTAVKLQHFIESRIKL